MPAPCIPAGRRRQTCPSMPPSFPHGSAPSPDSPCKPPPGRLASSAGSRHRTQPASGRHSRYPSGTTTAIKHPTSHREGIPGQRAPGPLPFFRTHALVHLPVQTVELAAKNTQAIRHCRRGHPVCPVHAIFHPTLAWCGLISGDSKQGPTARGRCIAASAARKISPSDCSTRPIPRVRKGRRQRDIFMKT